MIIYIVEDDADIRTLESYALTNSGFEVAEFSEGGQFLAALNRNTPDLVILDIMLPGEDGLELLRVLRSDSRTAAIPVMMVTAKTNELDKVRGLDLGADDYLAKPFGVMELVSRVRALLRRAVPRDIPEPICCGSILLDEARRLVSIDGQGIDLTFKEFELLKLLIHNQGLVLSRDQIMEQVWGFDYEGESRTIDMHIKTLRQKLGDSGSQIKTIRNVGYKLGD